MDNRKTLNNRKQQLKLQKVGSNQQSKTIAKRGNWSLENTSAERKFCLFWLLVFWCFLGLFVCLQGVGMSFVE